MAEPARGVFGTPPPGCDAHMFGSPPSVLDGRCRCLVCGHCGHHTGNSHQGHYWSWCSVTRSLRGFHFCCPDDEFGCELEHAAAVEEEQLDAVDIAADRRDRLDID